MYPTMANVLILFLCTFFFCSLAYALPSDKGKIMHVVADSADISQQTHKGTYIGNVQFMQGTTNLQAAKAITLGNLQNKLVLAIANGEKGKQAHYWAETAPGKPPLHAYADVIKYYPLKHLIVLTGNARVEQGTNSLSADEISYNTEEQHVLSQSKGKNRTTIILYPEKKSS